MLVTVATRGEDDVTVEGPHASVDDHGRLIVGMWSWEPGVWTGATIDKEITE